MRAVEDVDRGTAGLLSDAAWLLVVVYAFPLIVILLGMPFALAFAALRRIVAVF